MIDGLYFGWMAIDTIEEAQSWTSLIRFRNQVQQQTKSSTCQSFDINMIVTRLFILVLFYAEKKYSRLML